MMVYHDFYSQLSLSSFEHLKPKLKFSVDDMVGKNYQVTSPNRNENPNYSAINLSEIRRPNGEYGSQARTNEFSDIPTTYYQPSPVPLLSPVLGGQAFDSTIQRYYGSAYQTLPQSQFQGHQPYMMMNKDPWYSVYESHRYQGFDPSFIFHQYHKPKRNRTAFSPSQVLQLEEAFEKKHYVIGSERRKLSEKLHLTETQIKVWFQNRRTKLKRQKQDGSGSDTQNKDCSDPGEQSFSSSDDEEISEKSCPSFVDDRHNTNSINSNSLNSNNSPRTEEPIWNPHLKDFSPVNQVSYTM